MDVKEVEVKRILNPTAIDLGEFVINPYKGCALSCLYCYVRSNKVIRNDKRAWGEYVDVRVNAPELLEKELSRRRPKRVLLGSTTECFQPLELKYKITGRILYILNKHKVHYNILTRSPLLLEYAPLLKEGFCQNIYFTINSYDSRLKRVLEPGSADFQKRADAIDKLLEENLPVVPYFSPVLPYISDVKYMSERFKKADRIEFEGLNFSLGNVGSVLTAINSAYPRLAGIYRQMADDEGAYTRVWQATRKAIIKEAVNNKRNYPIYIHKFNTYFENRYLKK